MKDFWVLSPTVKQQIELRFGQPIRYSKDCENLALDFSTSCGETISPTTLKRLFGFAKPITQPRLYTLDVLAKYIGHSSWEHYGYATTQSTQVKDIHLLQQELTMVVNLKKIRIKYVEELCEQFGDQEAIFPFIINLIHLAFQWKDQEFLKKIFELPRVYTHPSHDLLNLYYIGQAVGTSLRNYPDANELLEAYGGSPAAHRYFIEWFVDEDYLAGYYGKLLDIYIQHASSTTAKLFYYLLKAKQAKQTKQVAEFNSYCHLVKQSVNFNDLHEILAARYIALSSQEDDMLTINPPLAQWFNKYIVSNSVERAIGFVFYLSRELYEHKNDALLAEVLSIFAIHFPDLNATTHWSKKISKQLCIYKAYLAAKNGKTLEAKKYLSQVDPFLFDSFLFKSLTKHFDEVCSKILGPNES